MKAKKARARINKAMEMPNKIKMILSRYRIKTKMRKWKWKWKRKKNRYKKLRKLKKI